MPRPPPPAEALTSTGNPIARAITLASWSEPTPPSDPGTVGMPSSLHARSTRSAISPRLAIRIFSNMASFDDHERLAELDRLTVLDQDLDDSAGARRRDLVHRFHRLNDQDRVARVHARSD